MKRGIKLVLVILGFLVLVVVIQFLVIKKLDKNIMNVKQFAEIPENRGIPKKLPSIFMDSSRFFVKLPLISNDTILAYCDTGGGFSMVLPRVTEQEHIEPYVKTGLLKGVMPFDYVLFNDIVDNTDIPRPYPMRNFIVRTPFSPVKESFLIIPNGWRAKNGIRKSS